VSQKENASAAIQHETTAASRERPIARHALPAIIAEALMLPRFGISDQPDALTQFVPARASNAVTSR